MRNRQARLQIRSCVLALNHFTIEQLCAYSNASRSTVQRYVKELLEQETIEIIQQRLNGSKGGNLYRLVRSPLLTNHKNKQQAGRVQLWEVMCLLQTFQISNLVACADVSHNNTKKYVHYLLKAGYLKIVTPRINGTKTYNVYRLIRNSGPLAPIVQRDHSIFDPNIRQSYSTKN